MASYDVVVTQGFSTSGVAGIPHYEAVTVSLAMSATLANLSAEAAESLTVAVLATPEPLKTAIVVETLTITGAVTTSDTVAAVEALQTLDTAVANGAYTLTAEETTALQEAVVISWSLTASDLATITATGVPTAEWVRLAAEKIFAAGVVDTEMKAVAAAASTAAIAEVVDSGKGASFSDIITLTAAVVQRADMYVSEAVSLVLTDALSGSLAVYTTGDELVSVSEDVPANQVLQAAVADGVTFQVAFGLGGHTYTGWVMNTMNFALSEYQDFPFNSFADIDGSYYGANQNGVYSLDGDDDAGTGIAASFTTGKMAFGKGLSRFSSAYLALRNDGRMLLKVIDDADKEYWYELTTSDWTLRDKRVKITGRGVKSRYWQFTIANADGADFELDQLVLMPILLSRR